MVSSGQRGRRAPTSTATASASHPAGPSGDAATPVATAATDDADTDADTGRTAVVNRRASDRRRLRTHLRRVAYGLYYLLPPRLRRRLVRLVLARYTVGAVALVYDTEHPGRMLLLRQPRSVGWSLPAGLLQRGERPVDGCVRELAEETGLLLSADDLTPAVPNAVVHTRGMWVDVVFEARVPASAVTVEVDGAEVTEAAWHRLDNLPPLTVATARLLSYYGIGPYVDYPEIRT